MVADGKAVEPAAPILRDVAFRGRLRIDEPTGPRWALALERLVALDPVVVRGASLSLDEPGVIRVEVASAWSDPKRITAAVARAELARAKQTVDDILMGDAAFRAVVRNREPRYELVNDYETGRVLVCTLSDGHLSWA